jgi:tetratricopeptide (TPR) repeat protein
MTESRPLEAEQGYRRALAVLQKLVADFPDQARFMIELASSQERLIVLLRKTGKFDDVEKLYRQAIARCERLAAANPSLPGSQTELARNHSRLGILLRSAGRGPESESELRKAQDLLRAISGPELERLKKAAEADPTNGLRWGDLAIANYRFGNWDASLEIFKSKEHLGYGIAGSPWQWFYIAMAHWQLDHKEEAHSWYYQSVDWVEREREKRLLAVQAEAAALMDLPDPSHRSEQAWEYSQTGTDLEKQGQRDKAKEAYGKALDLYEKLLVDFPTVPAYRTKLVELLNKTGRGKDVERVDREAISRLEKLAAAHPKMALYRLYLVHSYQALANYLCYEINQKAAAEKIYRESVLVREGLVADFPDNRDYQFHLAHGHLGLAFLFEATGRLPEAEKAYRQALVSFEKVAAESPNEPAHRVELATYLDRMGILLMTAKKLEEAEKTYRQAVAVWEKLANDLPADDWPRHELAYSHYLLGDLLKNTSRPQEAEQAYGKALALQEHLLVGTPTSASYRGRLALYHINRGNVYATSSQWDKAVADYTKAIELKPDASEAWSGRAFVHFHRQQWDKAVADFSKAIDLAPQVHANWWHRGHAYLQLAQWDKAAADFGKVLEKWPDGAEGWYWRGEAFAQMNQPDKALADLQQAIAKGFTNVEQMKTDPKLDPLRTREDFGKLLEEMERQGKSKK